MGLGGHGWTGKMNFYDDEAAVPLVVSWKGVTPPGRADKDHLVSALDVLPTICDFAGVKPPAVLRGQSLREVIEKPASPGHDHGPAKGEMFFDMEADPGEMKNLIGHADLSAEIDRHRALLKEWCRLTELEKYPLQADPEGKAKRAGKDKEKKRT